MVNPRAVVAHHHHVGTQLLLSERWHVPSVTFLRNPIDAVLSRTAYPSEIAPSFRAWLAFWSVMNHVEKWVLVVTFKSMTSEPSRIVREINARFNTDFNEYFPESNEVFEAMDAYRLARYGAEVAAGPKPNRPDPAKAEIKRTLKPIVENHRLASAALEVYEELASTAL